MQILRLTAVWCALMAVAWAQGANGILVGVVADPAKGYIGRARILAREVQTGATYRTVANPAGGYILPSLPPGSYELTVTATGYNKFTQDGLRIRAGETTRLEVYLQSGLMSEALASSLDESMLNTEGAEISTILTADQVDALPLFRTHIRNPLDFAILVMGVSGAPGERAASTLRVNGSPAGTYRVLADGQDITSAIEPSRTLEQQPSLLALSEFRLQTSNFAAEYGQASGGLFSLKSRAGTSQVHASLGSLFRNEVLSAGQPFSDNGAGGHVRPRSRDQDVTGNLGGPLVIPRIYDGRDRTLFFLNLEYFRVVGPVSGSYATVPTAAYRSGDFSTALTGLSLGKDVLGRDILENMIYDPLTSRLVNGRIVRDPFPTNRIDSTRFDPVAVRLQELIPLPDAGRVAPDGSPLPVNNFAVRFHRREQRAIPSVRFDHFLGAEGRAAFYAAQYRLWGITGQDGLAAPVTASSDRRLIASTLRLFGDYAVSTSMLAHVTLGYLRWVNREIPIGGVRDFPAADPVNGIGLAGGLVSGMPRITSGVGSANRGGLNLPLGSGSGKYQHYDKPSVAASLIYLSGNHTYKAGGEVRQDIWSFKDTLGPVGSWTFDAAQTALPYLQTAALGGGSTGFPYASLLLGRAASARISSGRDPRFAKTAIGVYWQDTWKASAKVTLDYGVRWDSQGAPQETHYRTSMFGPTVANPSAGGLLGGMVYEGFGQGRCNCAFTSSYPYAIGPRLGMAVQLTPKTVLRAGWGVSYGNPNNYNDLTGGAGFGWNTLSFSSVSFGEPGATLASGLVYDPASLYKVNLDPGLRPLPGQINSPSYYLDRGGSRPPRIVQWNVSLQRELTRNILMEVAYIGNRSVWNQANSLVDLNALSNERLAGLGLDINSAADRQLLLSPLNSPLAQARAFGRLPYAGYPATLTVAQSLRPYPQFGDIPVLWAPLGKTWYDAAQAKFTRRLAGGLSGTAAFTWQKELTLGVSDQSGSFTAINDVFNRPRQKTLFPQSRPLVTVVTLSYQVPRFSPYKIVRAALGGWTISAYFRYRSGALIVAPLARNNLEPLLFRGTYATRVAGQPLYLSNPDGKLDPNRQFLLNPAAWSDPGPGQWGLSSVYFSDYRAPRTPEENAGAGRVIQLRGNVSLEVRVDFYNVLNRLILPLPESANGLAPQSRNSSGAPVSGFGYIATDGGVTGSREGQFLARFRF